MIDLFYFSLNYTIVPEKFDKIIYFVSNYLLKANTILIQNISLYQISLNENCRCIEKYKPLRIIVKLVHLYILSNNMIVFLFCMIH